ncbi:hypothetical protein BKI52_37625 [marine bacterium AO1-C]|nr:hypothetical protein BKI52_37625 [marine bacterium AO1-C]
MWDIWANETFYQGYPNKAIELPNTGDYYMSIFHGVPASFIDLSIEKSSAQDTFYLANLKYQVTFGRYIHPEELFRKHIERKTIKPGPYITCNGIADGKVVDYYRNGNKKIEGVFKNGYLSDTLKKWFRSGELKSIELPVSQGGKFTSFYKNGNMALHISDEMERYYYESGLPEKTFKLKLGWFKQEKRIRFYFDSLGKKTQRIVSRCDNQCSGVTCTKLKQHLFKITYYRGNRPVLLIKRKKSSYFMYEKEKYKWQFRKMLSLEELDKYLFK